MAKKVKNELVEFDCPCPKNLTLYKRFDLVEGTSPEDAVFDCPKRDCQNKVKLQLDHQLSRDQNVYRSLKVWPCLPLPSPSCRSI